MRVRGRVISALTIHRQENQSRCLRMSTILSTCCHRHCVQTAQHRPFEECIHGRFATMGEMRVLLENACFVGKCVFRWKNACFVGEMHVVLEKCMLRRKIYIVYVLLMKKMYDYLIGCQVHTASCVAKWECRRKLRALSENHRMHVSLKNARFIAKCPIDREIVVHISLKNAQFVAKCPIGREIIVHVSLKNARFIAQGLLGVHHGENACLNVRHDNRSSAVQTEGCGHTVHQPWGHPGGACGANLKTMCRTTGRTLPH